MGKKDVSSNEYFKDPARYADILNTFYFFGEQIVLPEHVRQRAEKDSIILDNSNANVITVNRDIVKDVGVMMNTTIIALENQSDIHYAMPVRVMAGDAAVYHSQWRLLAKKHYDKQDLESDEYLSGIKKGEKLIPASTLVVYFGEEPWDGPRSLKEMLAIEGLPPRIQEYITDYPIHILEVRRFDDFEKFRTDLRSVFGFLRYSQDADKLSAYLSEHRADFTDLAKDATYLISQFSRSHKLLENLQENTYQTNKGGINMCKALDDLMERNLNKGIDIGIERGIANSIHMLHTNSFSRERIAELIADSYSLTPERADFYMEKYCPV